MHTSLSSQRPLQLRVMARKWHSGFAPGMAPTKQSSPPLMEQVERERDAYCRLLPLLLQQQQEVSQMAFSRRRQTPEHVPCLAYWHKCWQTVL